MANIEDCPGFETFGEDVKAARIAKHLARKTWAEIISIDSRYLENVENEGTVLSLPVIVRLSKCADFLWSGTSIQRSCRRKAHSESVSAIS